MSSQANLRRWQIRPRMSSPTAFVEFGFEEASQRCRCEARFYFKLLCAIVSINQAEIL
jgi:hypothetical protein